MSNELEDKNLIFTEEFYEEIETTLEKDHMYKSLFIRLFSEFERLESSGNKEAAIVLCVTIKGYLEMNIRIKERMQNDNRL